MMYSSFSSAEDAVTFEGDRWPAAFASVCSSPLLAAHRPALLSVGQVGSSHCWLPTPPRSSARHAMGGGAVAVMTWAFTTKTPRSRHVPPSGALSATMRQYVWFTRTRPRLNGTIKSSSFSFSGASASARAASAAGTAASAAAKPWCVAAAARPAAPARPPSLLPTPKRRVARHIYQDRGRRVALAARGAIIRRALRARTAKEQPRYLCASSL